MKGAWVSSNHCIELAFLLLVCKAYRCYKSCKSHDDFLALREHNSLHYEETCVPHVKIHVNNTVLITFGWRGVILD